MTFFQAIFPGNTQSFIVTNQSPQEIPIILLLILLLILIIGIEKGSKIRGMKIRVGVKFVAKMKFMNISPLSQDIGIFIATYMQITPQWTSERI